MAIKNHGPQVETVAIAFLTLAWISVILRSTVRLFIIRLFRIDDWLAILVLGAFTLYCSFVLAGEKYGTGRPAADVSQQDFQIAMKWWYCGEITYVLTTWSLKVYIGAFLMQICIRRSHINVIWTVIVAFTTLSVFYLFFMAFQCHPVSYFWTRYGIGASGKCISSTIIVDLTYVHTVFNAVADWTLGTLPIFLIWNLQMNTRTKVSAAVILSLGAIGSLATVIRIFYIHELKTNNDFLYKNYNVSIWSTVEPGMGIAASSLACMKPLFRTCFSKSGYLTSNATALAWSPSPPRRASRSTNNNSPGEIHLHENFDKSIRVETVIEAHLARDSSDEEARIGYREERGEIAKVLTRKDIWNKSLTGDTSAWRFSIPEGLNVV